ncbi:MAG TPA: hypothetical protein VF418_00965 [Sphingomonadaceae bacterium]
MTQQSKSSEDPAEGRSDIPAPRKGSPTPAKDAGKPDRDSEGTGSGDKNRRG